MNTPESKNRDLDKRYKSIEAVSLNLKLFEQTLHSISDALIITDLNKNILFVNQTASDLYGYSVDELLGKDSDTLLSFRNERNPSDELLNSNGKTTWKGKVFHLKKNRTEFQVLLNCNIISGDNDEPIAIVITVTDYSEQIRTKEELIVAETKYKNLFEELKDAIYESTPAGKLIDINKSGLELFGFKSKEDILQKDIANDLFYNYEDRYKLLNELEEKGFVKNYEVLIKNTKGEKVHAVITAQVNRNVDGTVKSYQGIIRDVTEIKRAENQLKKYLDEIATVNRQLQASEKELKKLNASKDKFFSIIAHDLRSPFTSIIGLSEFLVEDIKDLTNEEIVSYANEIYNSSKNVLKLLENLLQWARIQADRLEFDPFNLELSIIVNRCINLLAKNAANKRIELINNVTPGYKIYADENMISSVIQNLISNAIKFTRPGGRIELFTDDNETFIKLTVSDNGVGITDENLKMLFDIDSFNTTIGTNYEQGSGLGLILCKELIEKNNGTISVESTADQGSKFSITIPKYLEDKHSTIL